MSEHTREPWKCDGEDLWHCGESYESKVDPHEFTGIVIDKNVRRSTRARANARRIVACVNALAGIPTERLEQLKPGEVRERLNDSL